MQADYDGIFYNYEEQGDKLEYVGTEELDDIEVYVLKLTRKNGDVIDSYIDAENYVVLKTKSKMNVQGVESEAETIFSNYKYVDEMLNPFSMETKVNGETVMQMVFDEIAYNVDIDDSIFEMPEITAPADSMEVGTDKEPETETDKQPE
jgi:outer membrane lipoprotein-sorting protein